ncbi:type 11 methyltransferase [Salinisphaera sp. PC39]|uniref:class I SAM-dependent methyltransferase n=1 Tax=Salinisphaera sp. PC39 TaxID=1304156 RepID=UPI003341EEB5
MKEHESNVAYLHALRFAWLTRFYDPVVALTVRERTFKQRLIALAGIESGHEVLDIGCGTGTLAILIKQTCPGAEVTGLDGDPEILDRARRKAQVAAIDIRFDQGLSNALPYQDASFDRVVSSLFFHHLDQDGKQGTLNEIRRVLRPGGELHIADWGQPANALMRGLFFAIQLLDGFETTRDNVKGQLPTYLANAGLTAVSQQGQLNTIFGTLGFYSAIRS